MKKKILIVGKKSLLSVSIKKHLQYEHDVRRVSISKIAQNKKFALKFDWIINCTFDAALNIKKSADFLIANSIKKNKIFFVMISSSKVYGTSDTIPIGENKKCLPKNKYGKKKLAIEKKINKLLNKKALILRASNIIQFDIRKNLKIKTFINTMLTDLKNRNKINIPSRKFKKDFLPINLFNQALSNLIRENITGTYNIGSGIGIDVEKFAEFLIKGFGSGCINKTKNITDNMIFDIKKIKNKILYHISKKSIKKEIINLGKELKYSE